MNPIRIYAHRGANREQPENTLAAFERALELGADGIELDVRPCATGELVVFHDADLFRLTGKPGAVASASWDELSQARVRGEPIPQLSEVLDMVQEAGAAVNIELKGDVVSRRRFAQAFQAEMEERALEAASSIIVSTFSPVLLVLLRAQGFRLPLAFLSDLPNTGHRRAKWAETLLRPDGIHPEDPMVTRSLVGRAHQKGRFVNVWTVDEPDRAIELAEYGVDGVITNDVPGIRRALARRSGRKSTDLAS